MEQALRKLLRGGKFVNVSSYRSRTMGSIKSRGNRSTELALRLALVRARVRGWTLHPKGVFGTPDFYFPAQSIAVFVDGCFWHGCSKCGHIPVTRSHFWRTKFERNKKRSRLVGRQLRKDGIRVIRIWEHELKKESEKAVQKLSAALLT